MFDCIKIEIDIEEIWIVLTILTDNEYLWLCRVRSALVLSLGFEALLLLSLLIDLDLVWFTSALFLA